MQLGSPSGPTPAPILIVGEAFGADEEREGVPFVGASGRELTRMLAEAGIHRDACRITNVVNARPPGNRIEAWFGKPTKLEEPNEIVQAGLEELRREILTCQPRVIIALGRIALWATTWGGSTAISNWRGSTFRWLDQNQEGQYFAKVVPTYHPAAILRQWENRWIALADLRRAFRESQSPDLLVPDYKFTLSPSFPEARDRLRWLASEPRKIACDVETIRHRIAVVGVAWSATEALVLPLVTRNHPTGYYTPDEEWELICALRGLLMSQRHEQVWQNGTYDAQHFIRWYALWPRLTRDTMVMQHLLYPGAPKSLDFLSSLYCDHHVYWKDDLKDYKTLPEDDTKFQRYNAVDCVKTWEVDGALWELVRRQGMQEQAHFQMQVVRAALQMMVRGVRVDEGFRRETLLALGQRARDLEKELTEAAQ